MRPLLLLLAAVLACSVAYCNDAFAAPLAAYREGSVVVTLYDEPCALPAVSNLPGRATWSEPGKTFEGCYDARRGFVLMYFDDGSVEFAPAPLFSPVEGT